MEFSTFHSDLAEDEIKPDLLLSRYVALLEKEIGSFFGEALAQMLDTTTCPACDSTKSRAHASKMAFKYVECAECGTVYTAQMPSHVSLLRFYHESEARKFWLSEIWPKTAMARSEKVLAPLKIWVETLCEEQFGLLDSRRKLSIAELYPSNWGFASLWEDSANVSMTLVEPMFGNFSAGKLQSAKTSSATEAKTFDAVCLLESLGRVESPRGALSWAAEHLVKDGLCFVTTVLSTGFDIKTLGASSGALLPPDRRVLPSVEGILKLAGQLNFEVVELSTPGVLDLAHIKSAIKNGAEVPSVVKYWMEKSIADQSFAEDLQVFLQAHGLSSQGRIVFKKK